MRRDMSNANWSKYSTTCWSKFMVMPPCSTRSRGHIMKTTKDSWRDRHSVEGAGFPAQYHSLPHLFTIPTLFHWKYLYSLFLNRKLNNILYRHEIITYIWLKKLTYLHFLSNYMAWRINRLFGLLWSKLGVLWGDIKYSWILKYRLPYTIAS